MRVLLSDGSTFRADDIEVDIFDMVSGKKISAAVGKQMYRDLAPHKAPWEIEEDLEILDEADTGGPYKYLTAAEAIAHWMFMNSVGGKQMVTQ